MSVLILRLSGPLQSWGGVSRFVRRMTRREPTKSGIVGLMASAIGRAREESISDLARLELAVRIDQKGRLLRDFQTERSFDGKITMPLSYRYYLEDAKFLAALSGDTKLLEEIDRGLRNPRWPLYLGRRSCPPDLPVSLGIHEYEDVREALTNEPWIASEWYKTHHASTGNLEVVADAREGEESEVSNDYPLTFSMSGRQYSGRRIVRYYVPIPQDGAETFEPIAYTGIDHDPFSFL